MPVTTAAARPVITAPNAAAPPPALARVKHQRRNAKKPKPTTGTNVSTTGQATNPQTGTIAQQPLTGTGGSQTGTSTTKTKPTKKTTTTDTSTVQPPPFDEHTTSGQ